MTKAIAKRPEATKGTEWYEALIEEVKAIITEKKFDAAWALLEMYHAVGERILEDAKRAPITKLVRDVSEDLNLAERNVWYACQFYKKFPKINDLPEGKAMTWSKVKALLPANAVMEKRPRIDMEDVAHEIFKRYGVENCKQIVTHLKRYIKEFDEEDDS